MVPSGNHRLVRSIYPPTNARNLRLSKASSKRRLCKNAEKTALFEAWSKRNRGLQGLRNRGLQVRVLPGVLDLRQMADSDVPRYISVGLLLFATAFLTSEGRSQHFGVPLDISRGIVLPGGVPRRVTHHPADHQRRHAGIPEPFSTGPPQVVRGPWNT